MACSCLRPSLLETEAREGSHPEWDLCTRLCVHLHVRLPGGAAWPSFTKPWEEVLGSFIMVSLIPLG